MSSTTSSTLSYRPKARLIVGIDYGTTYSGICLAMSTAVDCKGICPWTRYPGASSHQSEHCEKTPSCIAFADENDDLDENAWGYQVEPGMKSYAWTKLLLDKSALASEYDDPYLKKAIGHGIMKLPRGKTAKDVATEYLRGMNDMYVRVAAEKFGEKQLSYLPVDVWLTVPATWSEHAKLLTKAAAIDAGFASRPGDRLMLIPEPEAAAHMALKTSIDHAQDIVEEGAGVMVCDLGGGTVDITTYEVQCVNPLKLREICVGAGGKCGGTFVDRNFYRLMEKRFGSAFTSLGSRMIGPGSHFMDQFELKKRDFSMKIPSRRPHRLILQMKDLAMKPELEKFYEDSFGHVLVSQDDMLSLFKPVADQVIQLVSDQARQSKREAGKEIDTLVLVGGFSCSPYVKERLQEWCQEHSARLSTPLKGAWSAVVCGAVLRGVEGSATTQKKCRRHYGHDLSMPYNRKTHIFDSSRRSIWYDPFEKKKYLSGFVFWKVGKGTVLDNESDITHPFDLCVTMPLQDKLTCDLYACDLDEAPETIENERVEKVGEIEFTLETIEFSKITEATLDEDGNLCYNLPLALNIRLSDEAGLLVFRILHQDKECGKAKLSFSYT